MRIFVGTSFLTRNIEDFPFTMKIIGLTGGICAGKSTIAKVFQEDFGVSIINADLLGHKCYVKGTECYEQLLARFGAQIINLQNDEIDRRALGAIVFNDSSKMKELTDIVWPQIRRMIQDSTEELSQRGENLVLLEAAVLIEAKWTDLVNVLICVEASQETTISRLIKRNSFSEAEARSRIAAQISAEERRKYADLVIENNNLTIDELHAEVRKVIEMLN